MPAQHFDNPIVELLVKLEQAKREKERTICVRTARRLLDDPVVVADLLRPLYYGANSAAVDTETLGLTEFERELFCEVAARALTIGQAIASAAGKGEAGGLDEYHVDRVHHMLVRVESKITAELRMAEADEYVRAGGSILDWREEKPLDEYVVERIESKLSELKEEPYRRLHVFIILTIEGRTAKHEAVRRVLDRFVRVGFADELLREVLERYPIEAERLRLPKPGAEPPGEAKPAEEYAKKPAGHTATHESTPAASSTGSFGAATALRGDEVLDMVNKMLSNSPAWTWKKVKTWLGERGVEIHNRESWRKTFGAEPPHTKGNPAFVNEPDVNKEIRQELQAQNQAFDLIDKVPERRQAARRR